MRSRFISWLRTVAIPPALRHCLRIYFRVSVIVYFLTCLCVLVHPRGLLKTPEAYLWLALLYPAYWLGPIDFMLIGGSQLFAGIWLIVIALFLAGLGEYIQTAWARTLLVSLSATLWFLASFSIFLSESM